MTSILLMIENDVKYPEFASRLNALISEQGKTIVELQKNIGVSYEMARRYTLGTAKPRNKKLSKIAEWLDVHPAFLEYGVVEPTTSTDVSTSIGTERLEQLDIGFPEFIHSIEIPKDKIHELFGRQSLEDIKIINFNDDSMLPTFSPKDLLFIDTKISNFNGDGIYVFDFEDYIFIKRLQRVPGRKLAALSDNDRYTPFYLEDTDISKIKIFGKLIKHLPLKFNDFA